MCVNNHEGVRVLLDANAHFVTARYQMIAGNEVSPFARVALECTLVVTPFLQLSTHARFAFWMCWFMREKVLQ